MVSKPKPSLKVCNQVNLRSVIWLSLSRERDTEAGE